MAGSGYAMFSNVVAPELVGFLLGTELLIWVALGGRGTVIGPVLAAIAIEVTSSYLSGSLPFYWKLLVGIAFVVVIVALPDGILPVITKTWRRVLIRSESGKWAPTLHQAVALKVADTEETPLVVEEYSVILVVFRC